MSQSVCHNNSLKLKAMDSKVVGQIRTEKCADYIATLKKQIEESDKFRDDFIKVISEFGERARAIRDMSTFLPYECEVKLSEEQKSEITQMRLKLNSNLDMSKVCGYCW